MKAIETSYKGYRFRSRTEARWAIFFDAVGISYQYEPEGFDLGEHGCYLPDFRIPLANAWVEIKGCQPTEREFELAYQLYSQTDGSDDAGGRGLYCFIQLRKNIMDGGDPEKLEKSRMAQKMIILCGSPGDKLDSYMILKVEGNMYKFNLSHGILPQLALALGGRPGLAEEALNKSRSARFEFGDSQKPWSK